MVEICTVKVCITKIANVKQKKILSIVTRKKKFLKQKNIGKIQDTSFFKINHISLTLIA